MADVSGPWFDDRASQAIGEYVDWARDQVAQQGLADWHRTLDGSLRHPTGAYESHINVDHVGDESVVNDDVSKYGPWLEGTGTRNAPVTRFAGYGSAARATEVLRGEVTGLVDPIPARFIERMGG